MFSAIDQLTTVVSGAPMPFLGKVEPLSSSLYFHLVLRIDGEAFSDEQESHLTTYIACHVRRAGGRIPVIDFAKKRLHILVGLSQFCARGTFVRALKVAMASLVKPEL